MLGWTQEHKMTGFFFVFSWVFFGRYSLLPDTLEGGCEPKFFLFQH